MWTTRDATPTDAAYVFDHVWERGAIELACFGVSRERWLTACSKMIVADLCVVFERDGALQALLGLLDSKTWFHAVEGAEMLGLTRHLRRELPALCERAGVAVSVYSLCVDEAAARWFQFLGLAADNAYRGAMYAGRQERRFIRTEG